MDQVKILSSLTAFVPRQSLPSPSCSEHSFPSQCMARTHIPGTWKTEASCCPVKSESWGENTPITLSLPHGRNPKRTPCKSWVRRPAPWRQAPPAADLNFQYCQALWHPLYTSLWATESLRRQHLKQNAKAAKLPWRPWWHFTRSRPDSFPTSKLQHDCTVSSTTGLNRPVSIQDSSLIPVIFPFP